MPEETGFVFKMEPTVYTQGPAQTMITGFNDQAVIDMQADPMMIQNVARSMQLKEQTDGVAANAFGQKFKDQLSDTERTKATKKDGSELFEKAKSARLINGAEEEYGKRHDEMIAGMKKSRDFTITPANTISFDYMKYLFRIKDLKFNMQVWKEYNGTPQERYHALDMLVEDFVNQDFCFDLSNDSVIAAQSLRFIQMKRRADAFLGIISENMDYWSRASQSARAAASKKISQALYLWDFYVAKEDVITDEFYSTHLDSEISYTDSFAASVADTRRNQKLIEKLQKADLAYEKLMHMEDEDREEKARLAAHKKITIQSYLDVTVVPKQKEVKSKSQGFDWLDLFGLPLKIVSFFMRDKRKADHGRVRYKEMAEEFDKKFPKYFYNIGEGRHSFSRTAWNEQTSIAPAVDLNPLFTDPVKTSIRARFSENSGLMQESGEAPENQRTLELYKQFREAADRYVKMGGIVNSDTTEMEMAFLDRMKEIEEQIAKEFPDISGLSHTSIQRVRLMREIMGQIRNTFSGNLDNSVNDPDAYASAVANSTAIIQSTTLTSNMDESNIKDIPLFTHYPNINDIKQSTIGDCYLVGAMTSFVKTSPQGVLNMFKDLGNGDVMVRLYEGYNRKNKKLESGEAWYKASQSEGAYMKPVYIKVRKHYETGDGNANDCVWPQLLEKAYAAAGFNMKGEAKVDKKGYLTGMEKELTCGSGYIALSHMSGRVLKLKSFTKMEAEKSRELKLRSGDDFMSDEFQHLLGAGIPYYIMETLGSLISANESGAMFYDLLRMKLNVAIELILIQYGSLLLQIKKQFMRKGLGSDQYAPLITNIANGLGLKLADDWDTQQITKARFTTKEKTKDEAFKLDQDDQEWYTFFDNRFIIDKYMSKLLTNLDDIINERDVTFDTEGGLDTDYFKDQDIYNMLARLVNLGNVDSEETLRSNIDEMNNVVNNFVGFAGVEDIKQTHIDLHVRKYEEFYESGENTERAIQIGQKMKFDDKTVPENMYDFMQTLKETLDAGGSVEISIPHFVSAVGMEKRNGNWFILIKDPFNVYNISYDMQGNKLERHEDGFLDVLNPTGYVQKRYLDSEGNESFNTFGGFRGLCWWGLGDLAAKMCNYVAVKPGDVRLRA